jgi:hypothetical protein
MCHQMLLLLQDMAGKMSLQGKQACECQTGWQKLMLPAHNWRCMYHVSECLQGKETPDTSYFMRLMDCPMVELTHISLPLDDIFADGQVPGVGMGPA